MVYMLYLTNRTNMSISGLDGIFNCFCKLFRPRSTTLRVAKVLFTGHRALSHAPWHSIHVFSAGTAISQHQHSEPSLVLPFQPPPRVWSGGNSRISLSPNPNLHWQLPVGSSPVYWSKFIEESCSLPGASATVSSARFFLRYCRGRIMEIKSAMSMTVATPIVVEELSWSSGVFCGEVEFDDGAVDWLIFWVVWGVAAMKNGMEGAEGLHVYEQPWCSPLVNELLSTAEKRLEL